MKLHILFWQIKWQLAEKLYVYTKHIKIGYIFLSIFRAHLPGVKNSLLCSFQSTLTLAPDGRYLKYIMDQCHCIQGAQRVGGLKTWTAALSSVQQTYRGYFIPKLICNLFKWLGKKLNLIFLAHKRFVMHNYWVFTDFIYCFMDFLWILGYMFLYLNCQSGNYQHFWANK